MTVNEISKRITEANHTARKLNDARQMEIGRKETLLKQRDDAIEAYKSKYGVTLTPENIDAELTKVQTEKIKEVAEVEQLIALISGGNFEEAQKLSNKIKGIEEPVEPVKEEPVKVEVEVAEVPAPIIEDIEIEVDLPVPSVAEPVANVTPVKVVEPKGILEDAVKEVKAPTGTDVFNLGNIPIPPSISLDAFDDMDLDMPELASPTPKTEKKSNFGSILNGSEFNPTGGAL